MTGVHCTLPSFGFRAPAVAMSMEAVARQTSPLSGGALPAFGSGRSCSAAFAPFLGAPIHNNRNPLERGLPARRVFALKVHAVQTVVKGGEGSGERPRRASWKAPGQDKRQGWRKPGTARQPSKLAERRGVRPLNPQQQVAVDTLLKNIRAWPVDADWDEMLGSVGLTVAHLDEDVLQNLFRVLPWYKSSSSPHSWGPDKSASSDNPPAEMESDDTAAAPAGGRRGGRQEIACSG